MYTVCDSCMLLDVREGDFTPKNGGKEIHYRTGRFYDVGACKSFKASIPADKELPECGVQMSMRFLVNCSERWCKLKFDGFTEE